MRFKDFKIVESKIRLNEDALPSNTMSASELKKDGRKYITSIAKSIREAKPFAFIPAGKTKSSKEGTFGVIDKISYNDKVMSTDEWESWASNLETDIKEVAKTQFSVDNEIYLITKMWKTESATGAMSINKGDAAEAILGAAITSKFQNGGRDITNRDVVNILKEVVAQGTIAGKTDYQTVGIENDNYSFKLTLNALSMKSLKMWIEEEDPIANPSDFKIVAAGVKSDTIKDLQKQISDAATYANQNQRATTAVETAKANPKENKVEIISDGGDATQQSSTKVDLKLVYDGQVTRLLSLKAGSVKQFGQVSGAEWEVASEFFESVLQLRLPDNLKDQFGFKDSSEPDYKEHNYGKGPFAKMYAEMAKQVSAYTQGDDTRKEYNLVQTVYDGINFHATRGKEGVTLVILSPSAKIAYKELAFDNRLLSALELYDLQVINEPGLSNHRISIVGNLKTQEAVNTLGKDGAIKIPSKDVLVQLRTALSGGAIRNLVEMGPLLKDLADVEKLDKAEAERKKEQPEDPNSAV